jgi:hypothetical protein
LDGFLQGDGEYLGIWPLSLGGGLSTTPSCIPALEKSIVEGASVAENIKNPLLFTADYPTFSDSHDTVFVPPAIKDLDMFDADSCDSSFPLVTTCKDHIE